ncbi:MAG: FAD-dependent oxidoreductase [Lachnospiraceae bacterium]|nr:FAD-dependent oxidoreductase [Lachnospiraceae bacterium]
MRYIVLGSSAAGINGVRTLRKYDKNAEIKLISKDSDIYSRCILHHYLSGHRTKERLNFVEPDFERLYRVDWIKGKECTGVDVEKKCVLLEDGSSHSYDKLLIATGAHTFIPPVPHLKEAKNLVGFRNIDDIEILKEETKNCENIVVMGAGLVGMDCISGLLERGKKPVVVEMAGWALPKQLDEKAALRYQKKMEEKGVGQYYGMGIKEAVLNEEGKITELILSDESRIPCDFLVVTAGVRPNVEFLKDSGIEVGRWGLVYDETGRTNVPDVYGAGDVSGLSPIWPVAVKEGIVAASNMTGRPAKMVDFFASKSTMNFFGIPAMSLGRNQPEEGECVEISETEHTYKKIIHHDGKIEGAVLVGDLNYGGILQQLIARRIDISKVKKPVFEIDYSDFFHTRENFEYYYEGE